MVRWFKFGVLAMGLAALLGGSVRPAAAQTVVASTLGPVGGFDTDAGYVIRGRGGEPFPGTEPAASFTPMTDTAFHSAVLALSRPWFLSGTASPVTARILADDGFGFPDRSRVIDSITLDDSVTATPNLFTFNSSLRPTLTANTRYWLAPTGGDSNLNVGWHRNNQGFIGHVQNDGPGDTFVLYNDPKAAFEIRGTDVEATASAVPEPGSLALFLPCLAGGALLMRKRRKGEC